MRRLTSLVILLLAGCLFWGAGRVGVNMRNQRPGGFERPENAPPMLALTTVALGGFRGLIADLLWLRATRLQDEGRFVELVQLADWIAKLDPASPQIWGYHAWNMAFNVSAMMSVPSEAWRWIESAIHLLRDEGLRYNPHDARLCFELGWIYMFKIGGTTDERHLYYKQQLADDVERILENGMLGPEYTSPPDLADRLHTELDMGIAAMRFLDERYGRLDWRLPESHAVYWARQGMFSKDDPVLLDRITCQCLSALFFTGKLTYDPGSSAYRREPAYHLLPGVMLAYETALDRSTGERVQIAFRAFIEAAIREFERTGKTEEIELLTARLDALPVGE